MNQCLFITSFDLLEILCRIYVPFVYQERFRIEKEEEKERQKEKEKKKKKKKHRIMIYVGYIN